MELISSEIPIVRYEDVQGSTKIKLSSFFDRLKNGFLRLCLTFISHYRELT